MREDTQIDEWSANVDLVSLAPVDNSNGLVTRLRTLVRRELITRGLMLPEPEDRGKKKR
jgi:hypothetical protein